MSVFASDATATNSFINLGSTDTYQRAGVSFTTLRGAITSATLRLWKSGTPPGTVVAVIYAHTGVYGSSTGIPTGTALATSDAVTATTLAAAAADVTFTFSGANQITLSNGEPYFVVAEYTSGGSPNDILFEVQTAGSAHAGRFARKGAGAWGASDAWDTKFSVDGTFANFDVTTDSVTPVGAETATGNGNIITVTSGNADERGIVYDTTSHAVPGNVAPASSSYANAVTEAGSFGTGVFTESLTGLASRTTYYARAYIHNATDGYVYGGEVSFTTARVTGIPVNINGGRNIRPALFTPGLAR